MRDLDDASLLERVLRRDDAAWRELLRRHRGQIFRCIQRAVGAAEADDAFGEFCVSILANDMHRLRVFDGNRGASLCSWLCMLAIKAAFDHRRRLTRFARPAPPPPANDSDVLGDMIGREERAELAAMVNAAPARDRAALALFLNETSTDDIAQAMAYSTKTVHAHRFKAIARLRRKAAA